jgi:hypothetical protein
MQNDTIIIVPVIKHFRRIYMPGFCPASPTAKEEYYVRNAEIR